MNLIQLAKNYGETLQVSKRSHVFSQRDKDQNIYLIQEGVLKAYYLSEDGKEYIKSFLFSGDIIASLQGLTGLSCSFSLLALSDCKLLKLPYYKVKEMAKNNLMTANSLIDLLLNFAMKKEQREYELLCLSAQQRYLNLLARVPNIYDMVTQNDMARYLGITPVALSRIKHIKK